MSTVREPKVSKEASSTSKGVTINVMGREFRVAAPQGEERQLLASVELLNKKMKELRDGGKIVGNERIAIMAALNIAHDYLQLLVSGTNKNSDTQNTSTSSAKNTNNSVDAEFVRRKMESLESVIEKAISEQEKLF
jgi:cell division protein ZapA